MYLVFKFIFFSFNYIFHIFILLLAIINKNLISFNEIQSNLNNVPHLLSLPAIQSAFPRLGFQ